MSMLNDRDRHLLKELEHQLEHDDPALVRQFKDPEHFPRHAATSLPPQPSACWCFLPCSVSYLALSCQR